MISIKSSFFCCNIEMISAIIVQTKRNTLNSKNKGKCYVCDNHFCNRL